MADPASGKLIVDFDLTTAGFQNSLGYYLIDEETGEIRDVGLIFDNARALDRGDRFEVEVPAGSRIGTFIIANGNRLNDLEALSEGTLAFQDADGGPATLDSSAPRLVHTAPDGSETTLRGDIWHSAGFGDSVGLNRDGAVHLRGMEERDDSWTFGWEDLPADSWDADFTDVVMTVRLEGAGLEFVNPDYDVSTPAVVPCFAAGTLIATFRGPRAVEWLRPGDRVITRDHGPQPLVWVGRRRLGRAVLRDRPEFRPVRIRAGCLGHGLPERDLVVSPQHRVLVATPLTEMMFGAAEVLVAAKHLLGLPGVTSAGVGPVTYVHLACASHQIVRAEGAWTESFQPGDLSRFAFDAGQRAELAALFAGGDGTAARPSLRRHEAALLLTSAGTQPVIPDAALP